MKRKPRVTRKLIQSLAQGEQDLHTLATKHGMSLIEMSRWIDEPRQAKLLDALEQLNDSRTSLLVAAARADAASALRRMATAESNELARKACVDLLKLQRDPAPRADAVAIAAGQGDRAMTDLNRVLADIAAQHDNSYGASHHTTDTTDTGSDELTGSNDEGGQTNDDSESDEENAGGPSGENTGDDAAPAADAG